MLHGGIGLLPTPYAIEPIGHVRRLFIPHEPGWQGFISAEENVLDRAAGVHSGIIFVIPLFLDHLPTRTAFATVIDHRVFLAHDARETRRIVAKAGGITDERPARI